MRKPKISLAIAIPLFILLAVVIYNLPPVNERLSWRVKALQADIKYAINPPEQVVFVPQEGSKVPPTATPTIALPTPSPTLAAETPEPSRTSTLVPTATLFLLYYSTTNVLMARGTPRGFPVRTSV